MPKSGSPKRCGPTSTGSTFTKRSSRFKNGNGVTAVCSLSLSVPDDANPLMKRVLTAAVAIPIVLLLTIYSPQWLFAGALGLVAALGAHEFLSLGAAKGFGRP